VLKKEFLFNNQIRGRFLAEARNMIQLNHPNIVSVQDLLDEPDFVAIELEYIEGETLKEYLHREGALPDDDIEKLLRQMLDAVEYIHKKGFVHRDIKPSNFMLTPSGVIKLTDFGIAKNLDGNNSDHTGTGTGMILGTPKYMSPEQVRNTRDVTAQSDIYSLGVVLWEMVTGKVPYDIATESTFDVFRKIVDEPLAKTGTKWDRLIDMATLKESGERRLELKFEQATVGVDSDSQNRTLSAILGVYGKIIIGIIEILLLILFVRIWTNSSTNNHEVATMLNEETIGTYEDDRDGKTYKTVKIGNQVWMAENLSYKPSIGNYWSYDNDFFNAAKYGYLYDWETACKVCPNGWHLPSDQEWTKLTDYLGGEGVAGTKMKSTSGWKDNGNGTNESGFSGLPGGGLSSFGTFVTIGKGGYWWSSSEDDTDSAWDRYVLYSNGNVDRLDGNKEGGLSVRCLRD
jgi:uncharacterized protein (TIGR02145 family)